MPVENEAPEFDMDEAIRKAAEEWDEELIRLAAKPPKKPPKKVKDEDIAELEKKLHLAEEEDEEEQVKELKKEIARLKKKEPPKKLLPRIPKRDLEPILEVFMRLSDDERTTRLKSLSESLQVAQLAEEDPRIKEDITLYQSGIVDAALRMLTHDKYPNWVTTEALKNLKKQVQRVFKPAAAPIDTGLQYKEPERMAKCLKVDLEVLLEEYTPLEELLEELPVSLYPKDWPEELLPKKPSKPAKRAAKKPQKAVSPYDSVLKELRKEYPASEYKLVVMESHMEHQMQKLDAKLEEQGIADKTVITPGPYGSRIYAIPKKKEED